MKIKFITVLVILSFLSAKIILGQPKNIIYWRCSLSYTAGYNIPINYFSKKAFANSPALTTSIGFNSGRFSYSNLSIEIGSYNYKQLMSSIFISPISYNHLKFRDGAFKKVYTNILSIEPFFGYSLLGNPKDFKISNYYGLSIHINFLTSKIKKS
ncbi:MAG: hypothetical protein JXL97_20390 [Bacteroidales bacterium]|nr:hypothetical protein [Bacteroidales bacterium]